MWKYDEKNHKLRQRDVVIFEYFLENSKNSSIYVSHWLLQGEFYNVAAPLTSDFHPFDFFENGKHKNK